MDGKLKSCPNCGSENLHPYGLADEVECNDCGELRSTQDWQADSVREKLLRAAKLQLEAENETLRRRCEAYEELRGCLEKQLEILGNGYEGLTPIASALYELSRCASNKIYDELEALEDVCGK